MPGSRFDLGIYKKLNFIHASQFGYELPHENCYGQSSGMDNRSIFFTQKFTG